jgi:two-component system sensor histidine kinase QseC
LVTLRNSDSGCTLCVQDSGPGMEPDAIQRLGERFFRVLGSDQPGSGLGWSIVKRLADVFGATVQIDRSQTLGGLSVTVVWPS